MNHFNKLLNTTKENIISLSDYITSNKDIESYFLESIDYDTYIQNIDNMDLLVIEYLRYCFMD